MSLNQQPACPLTPCTPCGTASRLLTTSLTRALPLSTTRMACATHGRAAFLGAQLQTARVRPHLPALLSRPFLSVSPATPPLVLSGYAQCWPHLIRNYEEYRILPKQHPAFDSVRDALVAIHFGHTYDHQLNLRAALFAYLDCAFPGWSNARGTPGHDAKLVNLRDNYLRWPWFSFSINSHPHVPGAISSNNAIESWHEHSVRRTLRREIQRGTPLLLLWSCISAQSHCHHAPCM